MTSEWTYFHLIHSIGEKLKQNGELLSRSENKNKQENKQTNKQKNKENLP